MSSWLCRVIDKTINHQTPRSSISPQPQSLSALNNLNHCLRSNKVVVAALDNHMVVAALDNHVVVAALDNHVVVAALNNLNHCLRSTKWLSLLLTITWLSLR